MRAIITVTEYPSMPGRFTVKVSGPGMRHPASADASDPGEAAAKAMSYAISFGSGGYQIFGSEKVMSQIPDDMRGRA